MTRKAKLSDGFYWYWLSAIGHSLTRLSESAIAYPAVSVKWQRHNYAQNFVA